MKNDILSIEVARDNLKETSEYWKSESYETMVDRLQTLIQAKTGYPPYQNTKMIREVCFKITPGTTLDQIREVLNDIENGYHVS